MKQQGESFETVAEACLARLTAHGVDYIFANAGTDFPPVIEAYARAAGSNVRLPALVTVPHENAAVAMAHGHYMVSGRAQAVMVHVNVGTANALCPLLDAWRENVPVFLMAGRTPIHEDGVFGARNATIHWGQEMRDQAAMLREVVKWDYELRSPAQADQVVDRALSIALTEPRGPVYLSLPREVLAAPAAPQAGASPAITARPEVGLDRAALARAADILAEAQAPLIITGRAGRDPAAVPLLARLAERFAIPVVEYWANYLSLPFDHPMHAGFDPAPWLKEADAILVLDAVVPWLPDKMAPAPDCAVIQVGPDPLFSDYPMRSFPADVAIAAAVRPALTALYDQLDARLPDAEARLAVRRDRIAERTAAERQAVARIVSRRPENEITALWASHCLGRLLDDNTILVNELGAIRAALPLRHPGSYFAVGTAGGLGWALPAALGAKLAAPERRVIATVGDGSCIFANPVACFQVAAACRLPILTIVFNNAMWAAVKYSTLALYPGLDAAGAPEMPLTRLEPSPAFEDIVAACGGYGERVEDPGELPAALERAVRVIEDEGRQALLNVQVVSTSMGGSSASLRR